MPWGIYRNGNSRCRINLENGTKIRETDDDKFDLEFPESIDLNIGNRCDGGCQFCYINASPNGVDAELLDNKFLGTIHPFTEVAINGNSLGHHQLVEFLKRMKERYVICNITINQLHFEREQAKLAFLVEHELVKGIGISLRKPTPEFIQLVKKYPNAVIHTINGILSASDLEAMRDQDLKLLILGYKDLGRGVSYKAENELNIKARQQYLYDVLATLPNHFNVVSFDNLAIEQLDVKRILSPEEWEQFYMGDEGTSSMFVDLVTGKFGVSSLCNEAEMHPILDSVEDMFRVVKSAA